MDDPDRGAGPRRAYVLGHSDREVDRLQAQARLIDLGALRLGERLVEQQAPVDTRTEQQDGEASDVEAGMLGT